MTLHIGLIVGGDTSGNAPTVERIQRMIAEAAAADKLGVSEFDLDVTFQVSGPVWQPPFLGVRAGRLSVDGRSLSVKIGVPEAFPSAVERDRFLFTTMKESASRAEDAVKRKGHDSSLAEVHRVVGQILDRSLEAPAPHITHDAMTEEGRAGSTQSEKEGEADVRLVKLYSPGPARKYWEAWHVGAAVTIHSGVVGDRGQVTEVTVDADETPLAVIGRAVREQLDVGMVRIEDVDQASIIIQFPPNYLKDTDRVLRVWDEVKRVLNERLGWLGLGECTNVDYSGELTFTITTVDRELAVKQIRDALDEEERLDRALIAVEESGKYVAVWPDERRGFTVAY
jgi:hypothetical protein